VPSQGSVVVNVTGAQVSHGVETTVEVVNVLNVEVEKTNVGVPTTNVELSVLTGGVVASIEVVSQSGRPEDPQVGETSVLVVDTPVGTVELSALGIVVMMVVGVHVSQVAVTTVV